MLVARYWSHRKAREALKASTVKIAGRDVVATWKLMVACVLVPVLSTFYAGVCAVVVLMMMVGDNEGDMGRGWVHGMSAWRVFWIVLGVLPCISYVSVIVSDTALQLIKSLHPLTLRLGSSSFFFPLPFALPFAFPLPFNGTSQTEHHTSSSDIVALRRMRRQLRRDVRAVVEEFGPGVFGEREFERLRMFQKLEGRRRDGREDGRGTLNSPGGSSGGDGLRARSVRAINVKGASSVQRQGTENDVGYASIAEVDFPMSPDEESDDSQTPSSSDNDDDGGGGGGISGSDSSEEGEEEVHTDSELLLGTQNSTIVHHIDNHPDNKKKRKKKNRDYYGFGKILAGAAGRVGGEDYLKEWTVVSDAERDDIFF